MKSIQHVFTRRNQIPRLLTISNRAAIVASKHFQFPTSNNINQDCNNFLNPNININNLDYSRQLRFFTSDVNKTEPSSSTRTQTLATATSNDGNNDSNNNNNNDSKNANSKPKFRSNRRSPNQSNTADTTNTNTKNTTESKDTKTTKQSDNEKENNEDSSANNTKNDPEKKEDDQQIGFDFKKLQSQFQEYTAKTFSTSDDSNNDDNSSNNNKNSFTQDTNKLREEYAQKREEMLAAQQKAKERQEKYASKLSLFREKNNFEAIFFNQIGYWWDYNRVKAKDWCFHLFMNSFITQFSQRFLSYEEFTHGVIEGFSFVCDCLANDEFEDIKPCVGTQIAAKLPKLKEAMLGETQEIHKVMAFVHEVRTIRGVPDSENSDNDNNNNNNNNSSTMDTAMQYATTPISLAFTVRYYYCLKDKDVEVTEENEKEILENQRFADFVWSSSWAPNQEAFLTFELKEDWVIDNIEITAMKLSSDKDKDKNDE